jgi:hypothetical protein
MALLNRFGKSRGKFKFKYNVTNTNWVDINSIISTITMNCEKETNKYWLDCFDVVFLDESVTSKDL